MNWDLENDNFLETLLNMGNGPDTFEFLSTTDDFMSSAATTPRSYDNVESNSCSDSGTSYKHSLLYSFIICSRFSYIYPRSMTFTSIVIFSSTYLMRFIRFISEIYLSNHMLCF